MGTGENVKDCLWDAQIALVAAVSHFQPFNSASCNCYGDQSWFCVAGDSISSRDGNVHSDVHLVIVWHAGISESLTSLRISSVVLYPESLNPCCCTARTFLSLMLFLVCFFSSGLDLVINGWCALFFPFVSYVKGYYSFGLVETNLFDRAEKVAREVNCLLSVLKGLRILRQGDGFCQLLVKVAKR